EAYAAVALDAAIHLVVNEGAEVLVAVGALGKAIAPIDMAGHQGHILQMAVAALVAHRAIVRVIDHQPFDDAGSKRLSVWVIDGNMGIIRGWGHTGHDQPTPRVLRISELLHGALAARSHRPQGRMPAKVGQVKAERQTYL